MSKKTIYDYDLLEEYVANLTGGEYNNADYVEIANARIKHYKENEYVQIDLFEGL